MKLMKCSLTMVLFFFVTSLSAHPIARLKERLLPEAQVGFIARYAETGEILQSYHANQTFIPASTLKLLTAVSAVKVLGEDYTFKTSLEVLPETLKNTELEGDLYLIFRGDPSLTRIDLEALFKELKQKGIHHIKGNLVIVANRFEEPWNADGAEIDDLTWGYAAPINTAILDGNAVSVSFGPGKTLGQKFTATLEDAPEWLTLTTDIQTVTAIEAKNNCSVRSRNQGLNLSLYGCLSVNNKPEKARLAITDPNVYAQAATKEAMKKAEIQLAGDIHFGLVENKHTQVVAEHHSEPLNKLINHMLKESDNLYAGSLTKTLGWKVFKDGSFGKGAQVIRKVIAKEANIPANSLKVVDGSGLSKRNFISPWQLSNVLLAVYHDPVLKKVIIDALPKSGTSGSLAKRMQSLQTKERILAKTGGMSHISSLAGYIKFDKHRDILFVSIENNVIDRIKRAKNFETRIVELLMSR